MIEQELYEVRRDLEQARDLLHDAVDRLTASFTRIAALVDAAIMEGETAGPVQKEVGAVVVALQFQDLIDQLLGHALKRLDAMERTPVAAVADRAAGAGEERKGGAPAGPKPVAQRHLDPGDVELF